MSAFRMRPKAEQVDDLVGREHLEAHATIAVALNP
jgi:hypothetical protein